MIQPLASTTPLLLATPTAVAESREPADRVTLGGTSAADAPVRLAMAAQAAPPRIGWIRGQANGAPLQLTFDRRQHTVDGTLNGSTVALRTDHDSRLITGEANGDEVDLTFRWTPRSYGLTGTAHGAPVALDADWPLGRMDGTAAGAPLRLRFSEEKGTIEGEAFGSPVSLQYDRFSGALRGTVNGARFEAEAINLDLTEVLQHFYLFAK